jgi:hypothetical protein
MTSIGMANLYFFPGVFVLFFPEAYRKKSGTGLGMNFCCFFSTIAGIRAKVFSPLNVRVHILLMSLTLVELFLLLLDGYVLYLRGVSLRKPPE